MERLFGGSEANQKTIIGHPVGLFVLFFTEMWERFSYYGMRALLVLYLVSSAADGGLEWKRADALILYSWYTMLVYLTPILGGFIADRKIGFRNAVALGALIMTAGHAFMAFETNLTFYLGLLLIILGNGLFKPNISSIVGQMYPEGSDKKDSAYTIFYMGINSGAFLGILLCGYIGERVGWSFGFGLAGIFMLFGMLQFWFAQKIFGEIGLAPQEEPKASSEIEQSKKVKENTVPFSKADSALFYLATLMASVWLINGVYETIAKVPLITNGNIAAFCALFSLGCYLLLTVLRLIRYEKVERDRLIVIALLSFFTVFFWMAFEQAGGSMTLFAKDYTDRILEPGSSAMVFKIINTALTFIPLGILSWILFKLGQQIVQEFPLTILFTGLSFAIIWMVAIYMIKREFSTETSEIPASWFQVLNSFFIITFAPVFSRIWTSLTGTSFNPSAAVKFAIGLILVGIGFGALWLGGLPIPKGASTAQVSMIWLVLAFLFHTLGELCISPVGLSYVNKLSPKRLIGFMFGIWFVANAVANKLAGVTGSFMDRISKESSMSGFFLIFVIISIVVAIIAVFLSKLMKKMMHGVE